MLEYNVKILENRVVIFDMLRDIGRPTSAVSPKKAIQNARAWFAFKSSPNTPVQLFWHKNNGRYDFEVEEIKPKPKVIEKPVIPEKKPEQLNLF